MPQSYGHLDWPANDAFLLIGDEALLHRAGVKGYPYLADLGEVWNDWTDLPFVFARWVARKEMPASEKNQLCQALAASLEYGWNDFEQVVAPKMRELSMSLEEVRAYMEGFRFQMTGLEHEAIERFRQLDGAAMELEARASAPTTSEDKSEIA
jgi:chorismate dehydratase